MTAESCNQESSVEWDSVPALKYHGVWVVPAGIADKHLLNILLFLDNPHSLLRFKIVSLHLTKDSILLGQQLGLF